MIALYMLRHLKTRGNLEGRYIGTTDEPLVQTAEQDRQIRRMKKQLPPVETAVVSPLKRCVETAAVFYPGTELWLCGELRECNFGLFENKNYEELKNLPAYQRWLDSGGTIPFPQGEGRAAFCGRCVRAFEQIMERLISQRRRCAAFVVHGGTVMAILEQYAAEKKDFYYWQPENGGGYKVLVDEKEWTDGKGVFREIEKL